MDGSYVNIRKLYGTRAFPNTYANGDYVEIAQIGRWSIQPITLTIHAGHGANNGMAGKTYIIQSNGGDFTAAPLSSAADGDFDFDVEVVSFNTYWCKIRARRRSSTTPTYADFMFTIECHNYNRTGMTEVSGTGNSASALAYNSDYMRIGPNVSAPPPVGGSGAGTSLSISAANAVTTGAGGGITLRAGSATGTGAGGSIILQPGAQATSGGNGVVIVRQPGGTAGTDEGQVYHDGTNLYIVNKEGGAISNSIRLQTNAGYGVSVSNFGDGAFSYLSATSGTLVLGYGATVYLSYWNVNGSTGDLSPNSQSYALRFPNTGGFTGYLSGAGVVRVIDTAQGGGSLAFTSSSPSGYTANQDNLVLTGSAFQRLSGTAARDITGVAPPSGGSHVDGRMMRIYNVGSFNLTLKHNSTSSTAANRFFCVQSVDIIVSANDFAELIYDSTNNGSGAAGWRVA